METPKGKYIVIEGNDGTGKSTQVELLGEYLRTEKGVESYIAHEPAGTPIADAIRDVIKNGELERDAQTNILLFTAARHEIWLRAKRELELGHWVLSARSYLSTIAYQAWGERQGDDTLKSVMLGEEITELTRTFTDKRYMEPDAVFMLSLDDTVRQKRIDGRGELEKPDTFEQRDNDFQARVNQGYDYLAETINATRIDANRSIESIQQDIRTALNL